MATWFWPAAAIGLAIWLGLFALGVRDVVQTRSNVLRNFPLIGRFEELLVANRHMIHQWAFENSREGRPFSAIQRKLVARRAAGDGDTAPFGTELDLDAPGATWLLHSAFPTEPVRALRFRLGGPRCLRPYDASRFNVGGMSYGSISDPAVRALVGGAKLGGFAVNTGEGGLAAAHTEPGGDLIFQFGTGYFGVRTKDGRFCERTFAEVVRHPAIRAVEVKISQGAKPGFGAILPASKNTAEIARMRGVEPHTLVHSPPAHTAFGTPLELVAWVDHLRELSGGLPIGIKLCLGQEHELAAIALAMRETGGGPDFVALDGAEGGTGAAHPDALNWVGQPIEDALAFAHDLFVGLSLRERVALLAAGKVASSFDVARLLALGADCVYGARALMLALGCVQALRCDTNRCPTGVTTADPRLTTGLVVADKVQAVARFHEATLSALGDLLGAAGLSSVRDLGRGHVARRVAPGRIATFAELWPPIPPGSLLGDPPPRFAAALAAADPRSFRARTRA